MRRLRLIDNCHKRWYRLWSVQLSILSALAAFVLALPDTLVSVWQSLPDEAKALIPPHALIVIPAGLSVAAAVARQIRQGSHPEWGPGLANWGRPVTIRKSGC